MKTREKKDRKNEKLRKTRVGTKTMKERMEKGNE